MHTENLLIEDSLVPILGIGFGTVFTVGRRSRVFRLNPANGVPQLADNFELHTVLTFNKSTGVPTVSYPTVEADLMTGNTAGLTLGSNNTQAEVMIRGVYAWKKTAVTVAAEGVQALGGFEKVL